MARSSLPLMIAEGRLTGRAPAVGIERPDLYGSSARALTGFGDALERAGLTVAAVEKQARDTRDSIAASAEWTSALDKYRIELDSDPDYQGREQKFRQRAEQLKAKLTENMSGAAALDFERNAERNYQTLAHSLRDKARKDEIEEHFVKLDDSNNKLLDVALREPDPRKKALHLEQIASNIEAARAANILSKSQADRVHKATLEKFERLTVTELQRTNPAAALRLLTAPEDKGGLKYLDPLMKKELALRVQRDMEQRSALAKAAASDTVRGVVQTLMAGQPATNFGEAMRAAAPYKDLREQLSTANRVYQETAEFRAKTLPQMADEIRLGEKAAQAAGTDAVSVAIQQAKVRTYAALKTAYQEDGLTTAMTRNAPAAEMLRAAEAALADPAAAPDQIFAARGRLQTAIRELQYTQQIDGGLAQPAPITRAAAADLSERAASIQDPAQQAEFLARMAERYGTLWREVVPHLKLADRKEEPARDRIASLGMIAGADPALARAIAEGRAARQANKNYAPTDDKTFRSEIDDRLGTAFKYMPAARELYVQETLDLYAKLSAAEGDTSGTLDTTRLKKALRQRIGGDLVDSGNFWRTVKTLPPAPGIDQAGFDTFRRSLTAEDMGTDLAGKPALPILPSSGRAVSAETIARNGVFYAVGEGRYRVEVDGELLADPKTGRPFTLHYAIWKQRMDALDARRGSAR